MTRTRIKICGIRTVEAAHAAVAAGADAVGLVFVPRSPRCVSLEEADRIVRTLPTMVEPIGLFVDESAERLREIADALRLRTVQLHGHESPADAEQLAPLRVLKALPFAPDRLADELYAWHADCSNLAGLLFDTPPTADLTGGSGQCFDWHALAALLHRPSDPPRPPIILAGGLTPENVGDAIRAVRPYAVDVSSGVESARGVKDPARIAAFCQAVREADHEVQNPKPRT